MKLIVTKIVGDALVLFFDKDGHIVHQEPFYGKFLSDGGYIRELPIGIEDYFEMKSVHSGLFEFTLDTK